MRLPAEHIACFCLLASLALPSIGAPGETAPTAAPSAFVHPGLLHTRADLDRMRQRVAAGQEPWKGGFEKLRTDRYSRADWKLNGPLATVTRSPLNAQGNGQMVADGNAAYQNALMWCVTGSEAHARKSVEILNRLLKGFEYTARYNLGDDSVPFVPFTDTTGKYRHKRISPDGRNALRPVYEMVWNHYQKRRVVAAPYTRQAADALRPEGAAHASDHPGFGTLLFSLP